MKLCLLPNENNGRWNLNLGGHDNAEIDGEMMPLCMYI